MGLPNWFNLSKTATDATTIGEEIEAQISEHNDDPNAHIDTGQSLEVHRLSEVIDHLAESVVNDKLAARARAHIAIVDPSTEGDFDTIASAIEYAHDNGGGNILITPGTHYITGETVLPIDVNLIGVDPDTCIVSTGATADDLLVFDWSAPTDLESQNFENLTFDNAGEGVFSGDGYAYTSSAKTYFTSCIFTGFDTHFLRVPNVTFFRDCDFEYPPAGAMLASSTLTFENCNATASTTSSPHLFVGYDSVEGTENFVKIIDSVINGKSSQNNDLIDSNSLSTLTVLNSNIATWDPVGCGVAVLDIRDSFISLSSAGYINIENPGSYIFNNTFTGGTGNKIRIYTGIEDCKILFNNIDTLVTDDGDNNLILWNGVIQFTTLATSATAMGLGLNNAVQLTPNSTRTLTTTIPAAGERRTLIILTSGTTSYTLTFGSGFSDAGTLATGTTSNRYFVLEYVSNGTHLIETRRTAAITP